MKDPNLPKRLFRFGREPMGNTVNQYCFIKYHIAIMKFLDRNPQQKDLLLKSQFGKLLKEGFKVCSSAQLLHYLLCRQLVTVNDHEIWILFGGKPFRFSLHEFAVATGLKCAKPPAKAFVHDGLVADAEEEDGEGEGEEDGQSRSSYWSELFENEDDCSPLRICKKLKSRKVDAMKGLKLCCLLIVDMLLLPTSNDGKLDSSHVRMIRDLDLFLEHPWGRDCFDFTMKSIKMRKQAGMCQSTMAIQGFVHGLQLVAMSCIPELLSFATTVTNKRKKETCISAESDDESDFEGAEKPLKFSMRLVKKLDTERPVNVSYTLHATDLEGADLSWSTETADENVLYMLDLLQKNQIFSNDSWSGGVDAADVPPEKEVNAKGKKGKEKCVAAAVPPFIKDKVKRKNKTDIGQTSDSSATLTVADVQDVVDKSSVSQYNKMMETLKGFDAKFSRLLEVQDLALKAGMKHMSDKIYCLSNQIDVIKLQQIADKELMSSHRVDAGVQKVTVKLPQTENLQAQGHLNKDVMDVVNEILDKAETSNETPLTDGALAQPINTDNAQPIDKISDSIKPPTFSLGLTQDLIPAAVEANTHTSDSLIRNLKTKQRTKRKLPTTTEPPTKQQKKTTAISPRHDPVPTVDDAAFQMLLKVVKTKSAFKIGNDASVSRGPFKELWEQTKRLSDLVTDKLIVLLQERFLEEFKAPTARPVGFMDTEFVNTVSMLYPNLTKRNYKIPQKVSKYVANGRQWFTEIDMLYCPYSIDGYWIGLCVDLTSHEIIVLQPDATRYDLLELQNELFHFAASLPFLIRRCATNNEMKTDAKTPFDFNCYEGSWEIKPKGAHGIATVLLLELHASSTLTLTSKLDQECVKNAGKNYGITLYEKFNSPLQVG